MREIKEIKYIKTMKEIKEMREIKTMKEIKEIKEIKDMGGKKYAVFLPGEVSSCRPWPILLLNGDADMLKLLTQEKLLPLKCCLAVMPLSKNRLDDFTPWPKPALNSRFPDFGGGADDYLSWVRDGLMPHIRRTYPVSKSPAKAGMLGQSLGGLVTLYSQTVWGGNMFGHAAAISPSCWYPGFLPHMKANLPKTSDTRWFISCGRKEGMGHGDIKRNAPVNARLMMEMLAARYGKAQVLFHWDDGGHGDFLSLRYRLALSWMEDGLGLE